MIKEEIKAEVDSLVAAGSRRPHLAAVLVVDMMEEVKHMWLTK